MNVENRRCFGEILWYGGCNNKTGKNNDFGFITNIGDPELRLKEIFFHKSQIEFDVKNATEGVVVSFEVLQNDKVKALSVKLIELETDEKLLKRALESIVPIVWTKVVNKMYQIDQLTTIDTLETKLSKVMYIDYMAIKEYIPCGVFQQSSALRKILDKNTLVQILLNIINKEKNKDQLNVLIDEFDSLIHTNDKYVNWFLYKIKLEIICNSEKLRKRVESIGNNAIKKRKLLELDLKEREYFKKWLIRYPEVIENLFSDEELFEECEELLPLETRIKVVANKIGNKFNINDFISLLDNAKKDRWKEYISWLPKEYHLNKALLDYSEGLQLIRIYIEFAIEEQINMWGRLSKKEKMQYIFYIAHCGIDVTVYKNIFETDALVKTLLNLVWVKSHQNKRDDIYKKFLDTYKDYILNMAWEDTYPLDESPILPRCVYDKVKYCEGKHVNSDNKNYIFCPRTGKACNILGEKEDGMFFGNKLRPWEQWTILDLLQNANLKESQLVHQLGGWVNRLNEIRERLRCTYCGKTLISNKKYSKNLAAYNSTVFYCSCGDPCNASVYISHCWACGNIIDSREKNIKVNDYYLCLHCSSGKKKDREYRQGTICPKCCSGDIGLNHNNDSLPFELCSMELLPIRKGMPKTNYECHECNHEFNTPKEIFMTGDLWQEEIAKVMNK